MNGGRGMIEAVESAHTLLARIDELQPHTTGQGPAELGPST
jgi:hypothetical protein